MRQRSFSEYSSRSLEEVHRFSFIPSSKYEIIRNRTGTTNRSNGCDTMNIPSNSTNGWGNSLNIFSKHRSHLYGSSLLLKNLNLNHIFNKYKNYRKKEIFENSNQDNKGKPSSRESITIDNSKSHFYSDLSSSKENKSSSEQKEKKHKYCCTKGVFEVRKSAPERSTEKNSEKEQITITEKESIQLSKKDEKSGKEFENLNFSISRLGAIICKGISETKFLHDQNVLLPNFDLKTLELLSTHVNTLESQLQLLNEFRIYPFTYFDYLMMNPSLSTDCSGDMYIKKDKFDKVHTKLQMNMKCIMTNEKDGTIKIKGLGKLNVAK